MKNIVRNTRKETDSPRGLHEEYRRPPAARMGKEEIKQLDASAKSYARLKNEVIYLREEVKLLKTLAVGDPGKARRIVMGTQSVIFEIIHESLRNKATELSIMPEFSHCRAMRMAVG